MSADGVEQRFPLHSGENLVGSHPGCEISVDHPSVSRHHAVLVQGPEGVELADLGSANGTFLDGRPVRSASRIRAGASLLFGTLEATLESVADGDLVPAGAAADAGGGPGEAKEPRDVSASDGLQTTASVGPLHLFTLGHLPRLTRAIREGKRPEEMALLVGAAVVGSLPVRCVEIEGGASPRGGGLFFRHQEGDSSGGVDVEVEVGGAARLRLRVVFGNGSDARLYRPVVEVAAEILGASRDEEPGTDGRPSDEGPMRARLPEPPFLDPAMRQIYEQATVVARGDVNVLVRGESGTGKEVLARYLHDASSRHDGPFVTLNCAALPRDLLEAELFGIERGVATGVEERAGKFEQADGGTLFLDEIGDMAPETQARILRVLQEGEVFRVGSRRPRPARVRVVSATNRDLERLRRDGSFREDLYYRIADWVVVLPPLRERANDISQLAAWFLQRESRRLGRPVPGLSRAALDALVAYPWPGNVRQLEREISRAILFVGEGELLDTTRLSPEVAVEGKPRSSSLEQRLLDHERRELETALLRAHGNVATAAEELEVPLSTFYRKMKRLGIERDAATP